MVRAPILMDLLRTQRTVLAIWGLALAGVSAMYIAFWPLMSNPQMAELIASMPEAMVTAMGYDRIGTPGGYITSTVYGLIAPALLLVFAIGRGARLIAGEEEDGLLELELTAPVSRGRVYSERLLSLWVSVAALVLVVATTAQVLVLLMDMAVSTSNLVAGSLGLGLLVSGLGTVAFAVGAAAGRRGIALGVASALAVASFMFHAIGPVVELDWMSALSPFAWYLGHNPLDNGFDAVGLIRLGLVAPIVAAAGYWRFARRDLGV